MIFLGLFLLGCLLFLATIVLAAVQWAGRIGEADGRAIARQLHAGQQLEQRIMRLTADQIALELEEEGRRRAIIGGRLGPPPSMN